MSFQIDHLAIASYDGICTIAYLFKYNWQFETDDEERRNFKKQLFARIPLLTASCVQLSAKMSTICANVNANHVYACLRQLEQEYSMEEINTNLFHIFSTLGEW